MKLRLLGLGFVLIGVVSLLLTMTIWFAVEITPDLPGLKWRNVGPDVLRFLATDCLLLAGVVILIRARKGN